MGRDPLAQYDRYALPLYGALFLLVYGVCVLVPYGFADDYRILAQSLQGGGQPHMIKGMIAGGRPVQALLTQATFALLGSVDDLRALRLAGVLGIALLAWLLYRAFLRAGQERWQAALLPVLICAMPPFQVYAVWATAA
jgi:hypothetical protein